MSRVFLFVAALKVEPQKSIETRPPSPTCEGNVVLETINGSRMFNDLRIFSSRSRKRTSSKVTFRRTGYELATVEGSCCWKAWSSRRGGSFHVMRFAGVHEPGFTIRRIELLKDCHWIEGYLDTVYSRILQYWFAQS